jgi:hemerythrin HHE cation binding domain-containing protein
MRFVSPTERRRRRSHHDAAAEPATAALQTIQHTGWAGWPLMTTIHDALRRDLDQLIHPAASHPATRARWIVFRDQLRFHFAAEHTAMWPQVQAKLTGEPQGQALLDAMEDERRLIGPLQAVTDDAFTMDTDPERLRQLLIRLRTRVISHLAHEEAEALPLISQIMSPGELGGITRAIRGGHNLRRAAATVPWALAGVSPDVRTGVLDQLPVPTRVLCQRVWLPRQARNTPPL